MKDNEFVIPPISGEEVPLRELSPEQEVKPQPPQSPKTIVKQSKWGKKTRFILIGLIIVLLVIIGVLVVVMLKIWQNKQAIPIESPPPVMTSPSPEATTSALSKDIEKRWKGLQNQVQGIDLHETDLAFPVLDFNIKF